jgi:hypothetical protein
MNVNPDSPDNWGRGPAAFSINGRPADAPRQPTPAQTTVAQDDQPPTRAQNAVAGFERARAEYQAGVAETRADAGLTDEGKARRIRDLAQRQAARVEAARGELLAVREEAASDYAETYGKLRHVEHTAEGETRASRDWQRHRTAIDAAKSPTVKLQELIRTVPEAELGVLLAEGPAHLANAHGGPVGWVDTAVEQRSPELAAARQRLDKANRLVEVANADAARLRQGFESGHAPTQLASGAVVDRFDPEK